jgi:hypothetical protein
VILLQLIIGGGLGCGVRFHRKLWSFCTWLLSKRKAELETVPATQPLSMQSLRDAEISPLDLSRQLERPEYRKVA